MKNSFTPAAGYYLAAITVDGVSVAPDSTYTLEAVNDDHTLSAIFRPYSPFIITSGLSLWLDADDMTSLADDGAVSSWYDISGNGRHATQQLLANQPLFKTSALNGNPVVRFDGSNDVLGYDGTFLAGTDYTVFIVEARNDDQANYLLGGTNGTANNNMHLGYRTDTQFTHDHWTGGYNATVDGFTSQEYKVHSWHLDNAGSARAIYTDGALLLGNGNGTQIASYHGAMVGGHMADRFNGDIAEILIYDRYLDADERNQIGFYLEDKYAIDTAYVDSYRPTVTNTAADGVEENAAWVNGTLTSAGAASTLVYAYWDTSDKGTSDPSLWTGSAYIGVRPQGTVRTKATGLQSDTAYVYRFRATNTFGQSWSAPATGFYTGTDSSIHDYRVKISASGYVGGETLTNFPMLVRFGSNIPDFDNGTFGTAYGSDLRFMNATMSRTLNYEIDTWATDLVSQDVGAVAAAGSYSRSGGDYTVAGSGKDISGTEDEFHYAYCSLSGDGSITVRVRSIANPGGNVWCKAGVMIRENLYDDTRNVLLLRRPDGRTDLQWRSGAGGTTSNLGDQAGSLPGWLRLVRSGNTFTAYVSADGATWTEAGEETVTMAADVLIGLAVTSHNDGTVSTAIFDNVSISTPASTSYVWVQVPRISSAEDYIWALWGNESLTDAPSYTTDGSTWSEDFAGVWHLRETNAVDSTAYGNDGTAGGSVGISTEDGAIGKGQDFPGGATTGGFGYIDLPGDGNLKMGASLTMTTWTRWDKASNAGHGRLVSKKTVYNAGSGWHVNHQQNNDTQLSIRGSGGTEWSPSMVTSWTGNQWQHVAVVYDGATAYAYGNGVSVGSSTVNGVADADTALVLGNNASHGEWNWDGMIDEFRVAPVTRSAKWIEAEYENQKSTSTWETYGEMTAVIKNYPTLFLFR